MIFGVETAVVLTETVLTIGCNIVILLVVVKTDTMSLLNRYFFVSLTVADLAVGLLVTPFSVWATVFDRWLYGDRFCQIEACLSAALGVAGIHSLAWLSVDQYVAFRKPDRHATIMTPTRSACWVGVVWSTAVGFSASPLFGDATTARYYSEAYFCAIDWTSQTAYFLTAATLVLVPPIVALAFSNFYIFTSRFQRDRAVYDKPAVSSEKSSKSVTASAAAAVVDAGTTSTFIVVPAAAATTSFYPSESSRPELYTVTVVIGWIHLVTWLPWCVLQLYCHFAAATGGSPADPSAATAVHTDASFAVSMARTRSATVVAASSGETDVSALTGGSVPMLGPPALHFWLAWFAIGNSFWKFLVYVLCFHDFRTGLKILYCNYIACR
jgi:hypothetical protein